MTPSVLYIIAAILFVVVAVVHLSKRAIESCLTCVGLAFVAFGLWRTLNP